MIDCYQNLLSNSNLRPFIQRCRDAETRATSAVENAEAAAAKRVGENTAGEVAAAVAAAELRVRTAEADAAAVVTAADARVAAAAEAKVGWCSLKPVCRLNPRPPLLNPLLSYLENLENRLL